MVPRRGGLQRTRGKRARSSVFRDDPPCPDHGCSPSLLLVQWMEDLPPPPPPVLQLQLRSFSRTHASRSRLSTKISARVCGDLGGGQSVSSDSAAPPSCSGAAASAAARESVSVCQPADARARLVLCAARARGWSVREKRSSKVNFYWTLK